MKSLVGVFVILAAILGGGGYFAWQFYREQSGSPVPIPETDLPAATSAPALKPEEIAAAKRYHELSKQIESDRANGPLFAQRGRAMMDGRGAVMGDLPKLSVMAIEDLTQAEALGHSAPELYRDIVVAVQWLDALHPMDLETGENVKGTELRQKWYGQVAEVLDKACVRAPAAHRARVDFIEFRLQKPPVPTDIDAWRGRQLESLDTLIKLEEGAADAERAGDVAKGLGRKALSKAYYLKAIELSPGSKDRIEVKMKRL